MLVPKEYILIQPAAYNEFKLRNHINIVFSLSSVDELYQFGSSLLMGFFKTKEHREVALDILRFTVDKEPSANKEIIKKRFLSALSEAGYLG